MQLFFSLYRNSMNLTSIIDLDVCGFVLLAKYYECSECRGDQVLGSEMNSFSNIR